MLAAISNLKLLRPSALLCALSLFAMTGCDNQQLLGPVANERDAKAIREVLATSSPGGDAGTTAAVATGTGWGTIRGTFVLDGDAPQMLPYDANKDEAVCKPGGHAHEQEWLVVDDSNKGIKNVAVYLRTASRVHESAQPTPKDMLFDQKKCVFLTHVAPAFVGQTVLIKNSDPVGHNTKIEGSKNQFNQTIPAGETIPFKLQKEEATPAPVACSIHPWMKAFMLPRANGYVAVTDAAGNFQIANLPAGEPIELQVWHESATGPGNVLVVTTPEAKALKWNGKGRFNVTLQPDETKEIKISVPRSAFRS
jgi:hypothetical protein